MRKEIAPIVLHELDTLYKSQPHVAAKIESKWGSQELNNYFYNTIQKNRHSRQGFDIHSFSNIFKLYLIHQAEYGNTNTPIIINPNVNI